MPVEQFVTGAFEVTLDPGELLQAIRIPRPSRTARCGYYKVCRKAGEFALASGAVLLDAERGRFQRGHRAQPQGRPIVIDDARGMFAEESRRPGAAARLDETAALELLRRAGSDARQSAPAHHRPGAGSRAGDRRNDARRPHRKRHRGARRRWSRARISPTCCARSSG